MKLRFGWSAWYRYGSWLGVRLRALLPGLLLTCGYLTLTAGVCRFFPPYDAAIWLTALGLGMIFGGYLWAARELEANLDIKVDTRDAERGIRGFQDELSKVQRSAR